VDLKPTIARTLAAFQAIDLVYTQTSKDYGDAHLDHLGVPHSLRRALPIIKASAVAALVLTADRPRPRAIVGAALLSYYTAAVTFHREAGDPPSAALPAAACALCAGLLV
jgi:hypothetical protein